MHSKYARLLNSLQAVAGLSLLLLAPFAQAQVPPLEAKPADPYFAKFAPVKAPAPTGLLL